jgi:probable phosphoglycerate mutase
VVRHGRTASNAEGRYQGSIDTELDEVGIAQAQGLHAALPRCVDVVLSSPMRRARQTADIVCGSLGVRPVLSAAFRERSVGLFEGLTAAEAATRHPGLWAIQVTRQWSGAPPGGESIEAVFHRVSAGLAALQAAYPGRTVLLVAHGFVSKVIRALLLGRTDDFFEWTLGNCAHVEFVFTEPLRASPDDLRTALPWMHG